MNKSSDISQIIIDLIMDLNQTHNTGNKALRQIKIWHKMVEAKNKIKNIIKKNEYDAYDIFNFMQFIGISKTLNLGRNLPKNISYSYHKAVNPMEVSSGTFSVLIKYSKTESIETIFKPVIGSKQSEIYMEWIVSNNESTIVDFKTVTSDMHTYNTKVNKLVDRPINPTEPVTITKILEFSSASILYQAFLMCIESIFNDIEKRYKKK